MEIRTLTQADAGEFQKLRLSALRESPLSFASSFEDEHDLPIAVVAERVSPAGDHFILGALDDAELIGCIGLVRDTKRKCAHKAFIWGMYVAPAHRGKGIGRQLLTRTLEITEALPGLRQVTLIVNSLNEGAIAFYEQAGFRSFGVEPDALFVGGRYHDDIHMVRFFAPA